MRKTFAFLVICLLAPILQAQPLIEETRTTTVNLTPINQPPGAPPEANGAAVLRVTVNRNATTGNITPGGLSFQISFTLSGNITITGVRLQEGASLTTSATVINANLATPQTFADGKGHFTVNASNVTAEALRRLRFNPSGFYISLLTTANPEEALRGQLARLDETLSLGAYLEFATAPLGLGAAGVAIRLRRDGEQRILGGAMELFVGVPLYVFDFVDASEVRITGLQIRAGMRRDETGPLLLDLGIPADEPLVFPLQDGLSPVPTAIVNFRRFISDVSAEVINKLLANPQGFYVSVPTNVRLRPPSPPGNEFRGQFNFLSFYNPLPLPLLRISAEAGATPGTVTITAADPRLGEFFAPAIVINDVRVNASQLSFDRPLGRLTATIPAPATDTFTVAISEGENRRIEGGYLTVVPAARQNTIVPVTVEAAAYSGIVAPESIATVFGTKLATSTAAATTFPLPERLKGTTVYIGGVLAPLFFVSPEQINLQIPPGVLPGRASVVIVAGDGTVSTGSVNIVVAAPALFTTRADGTGAPAAVASATGVVFDLPVGNSDGTPRPLDAGNFVALFGTGVRLAANPDLSLANGVAESLRLRLGAWR